MVFVCSCGKKFKTLDDVVEHCISEGYEYPTERTELYLCPVGGEPIQVTFKLVELDKYEGTLKCEEHNVSELIKDRFGTDPTFPHHGFRTE